MHKTVPCPHSVDTWALYYVLLLSSEKGLWVQKMVQGKSPHIISDLVTTRFEEWHNSNIIYDDTCRVKEMGLNREPERFMDILVGRQPHYMQ